MIDKSYILNVVQNVLNSEFSEPQKRRLVDHHDRVNFACCYCQDSSKNKSAKRGNIWYNKLIYVCFNCDKKTSFTKFCKDFNQRLDPEKRLDIINHLDANINANDYHQEVVETDFSNLLDLSDIEKHFNSSESFITDFESVKKGTSVYLYLLERGIPPQFHKNIWTAKYWKGSERYERVICLLNRKENKVLSIQIRNLKEGRNRMFKFYNYEMLYKMINNVEQVEEIDLQELTSFNKLSHYFNILNINFESKITIFEGYIDSLFYPNSIGVVGVNTDFSFLENNNLDIQYFFDNDKTGHKKSEEKIKEGFSVFLWNKMFESIVEKKNVDDPYSLLYRISKVKDLNKLAQVIESPYSKLKLEDYFSKDKMDIKWIPKVKEYKKKIYQKST
jgi:hypothetical protein